MLAEDEGSGAKVSYNPAGRLWRGGDGPENSGLALFSAAIGSGESSCLRLQLRGARQLLVLDLDYTVSCRHQQRCIDNRIASGRRGGRGSPASLR